MYISKHIQRTVFVHYALSRDQTRAVMSIVGCAERINALVANLPYCGPRSITVMCSRIVYYIMLPQVGIANTS